MKKTLFLFLMVAMYCFSDTLKPKQEELNLVATKIFANETGGNRDKLIYWNDGENFPSLGIGHFIWYPENVNEIYDESFPKLVDFYRENNVELPAILEIFEDAPWDTKSEMEQDKKNGKLDDLYSFLDNTKDTQILFIYDRLEKSLDKMLEVSEDKENVKKQFYRVANSENGLYPLIDYVNFKGEGIKTSERYNNVGWGLLQVLENMKGTEEGQAALIEFSDSAKKVLTNRVENSPKERNEKKWLEGWLNRCETYKNI